MEPPLRKILAVCGDPGGANAVAPVLEEIARTGAASFKALAYREARSLWKQRGIPWIEIPERSTDRSIRRILEKENPTLLLTGTSFNPVNLEKKFISAARKLSIPSLSVMDFWSNYRIRFSDEQGQLIFVPDRIAVMDNTAFTEMVAEGFDPARLVVTGQPLFDDLGVSRRQFSPEKKEQIRAGMKTPSDSVVVLFISQPISSLFGEDFSDPCYPGYTEKTVLPSLINVLERLGRTTSCDIVLVIRPHPREKAGDYAGFTSRDIRVIIADTGNTRDIALASDLVTGMSSIFLVEAVYLGCRVISIQPGLRFRDPLPTNRSLRSVPVYRVPDLFSVIQKALNEPAQTENSDGTGYDREAGIPEGQSAQRILELIKVMIKEKETEGI